MATATKLPVNISEEAADRILELGVWSQFKRMLEHTKQSTPALLSIAVSFDDQAGQSGASLLIVAEIDSLAPSDPYATDENTERLWDRWAADTFEADVLRHFCMLALPSGDGQQNGR